VYLDNAGTEVGAASCGHLGNTALLSPTIREQQAWSRTSGVATTATTLVADAAAPFARASAVYTRQPSSQRGRRTAW
jgi:hypothetical protein